MKSRVLVFGRNGQLASDLLALGSEADATAEVCAVGRDACDLSQPEAALRAAIRRMIHNQKPSAIVNAAAYTAVDKAESEREAAFHLNAVVPGMLALAAAEAGVPFLHFSTDYVFDGKKPGPYTEDDPTSPLNVYGESKLAGECAVRDAGGPSYIFRTTWVYGIHGANFFKTILRFARERPELRIVADQEGAPTSSLALARATLRIAELLGSGTLAAKPGIYNLAAAGRTTWHGFASHIVTALGQSEDIPCRVVTPIRAIEFPTPARRPANSVLAGEKFLADFGFSLPSWEQGFEEVWQSAEAVGRVGAAHA